MTFSEYVINAKGEGYYYQMIDGMITSSNLKSIEELFDDLYIGYKMKYFNDKSIKSDDFESINVKVLPETSNENVLTNLNARYLQESDTCSSNEFNTLTIENEDGGGGNYFIIKTDRWAFDSINEIVTVLEDFKKRLMLK
jgi:hypothetical protein